ncbi:FecCD family ABC transporter permease [Glutamicibacter uratoxydans]|uniref:FecCD family ABC transporter permease n=1 Tax=Glutamicibacter uratoxydans TaxID=43667 RepID=UPI003D6FBDB9
MSASVAERRTRTRDMTWLLVVALLLGSIAYIFAGRDRLPADEVLAVLAGQHVPGASFILLEDRLPRLVVGILAGAGFGISGSLFQRWLGNPLASPDVIGIGYGAATASIVALIYVGATGWGLNVAALLGGLGVAGLIYWLSASGSRTGPRLILAGLAIGAMLQALIQFLLTQAQLNAAADAIRWLAGSLAPSTWPKAEILAIGLGLVGLLLPVVIRQLKVLELGDDTAAALGLSVGRSRLLLVFVAVAMGAIPVAVTGPLAFVAFLAGPITAALTRGAINIGMAALTGAVIVTLANFLAANLFAELSLPVGVITGAFGAPFLTWVLMRANKQGNGG